MATSDYRIGPLESEIIYLKSKIRDLESKMDQENSMCTDHDIILNRIRNLPVIEKGHTPHTLETFVGGNIVTEDYMNEKIAEAVANAIRDWSLANKHNLDLDN